MEVSNPREPEQRTPGPWQGMGCFWFFAGIALLAMAIIAGPEFADWLSRQ